MFGMPLLASSLDVTGATFGIGKSYGKIGCHPSNGPTFDPTFTSS